MENHAIDQQASASRSPAAIRLWLIGTTLALMLFVRDYSALQDGLIEQQAVWGRDFINVWTGGLLLNGGHGGLLFDLDAYQRFQMQMFGPLNPHNYSYPPLTYPLAQFLSLFPYPVALAVWTAGTGALFVHAARPWWPSSAGPAWLALLTPAAVINVWAGHYGFLMGALFLLGWRNLDERPVRAGLFFGLMLIKPHLAALVPLVLVIRRDWTAIVSAGLTAVAAIAATGAVYGFDAWTGYLLRTSAVQTGMIDPGGAFYGLLSTSAVAAILSVVDSWNAALIGQFVLGLAGVGAVVWAVTRRVATPQLATITATATFLVLPYAFAYDLTVVAVAAVSLMCNPLVSSAPRRGAAIGLAAPSVGLLLAMVGLPILPVLLALLLGAQFKAAGGKFSPGRAAPAGAGEGRSA